MQRIEIVDEVALGRLSAVEQRLVQFREGDTVAGFTCCHGTIFAPVRRD